ncbi:G-protein coupled receptor family C group 6 member A-like [Carassius auratus]|uniref:G-protein coupled receptor family C group 6 member A n=1 Tax=Carassius auratus TaxID=7957 RepID=A0A6P6K359_CARAU|nr:G-protein coupled receptor family C group 6 member A-like [Carassius auratus]
MQLGDFMFGGLFPVHQSFKIVNMTSNPIENVCETFTVSRLIQSLAMTEAVEAINKSPMLNGLTLGYKIMDTCSDVTTALQHTDIFMDKNCGSTNSFFQAVIGEYHSEVSIAVARYLTMGYMPQISYGSTAGVLSDKKRFPTFRRTVPEDDHQAKAITKILKYHNWTWIGIIATDGDYGRYAADQLEAQANKQNIFVSYRVVLPDFLNDESLDSKLNETIQKIANTSKVQVIVSFAKSHHMSRLFDKLTPNASGRFWIAGDSWSTSLNVLDNRPLNEVGKILGIIPFSGNISRFRSYIDNLDLNPDSQSNNTILQYFIKGELNKSRTIKEIRETLQKAVSPSAVFSVQLAVMFAANAIKDICSRKTCRGGFDIQRSELNDALAKTMLTIDNEKYSFSKSGDLDTGYDINIWEAALENNAEFVNNVKLKTVARYMIKNESMLFLNDTQRNPLEDFTVNAHECIVCPKNSYSVENSTTCTPRMVVFLSWREAYCIILVVFACLGILLTLIVMLVYLVRWDTPVVLAAGGPISILILLSLLGTFTSVILFGGKPTDIQCKTGQVLFGLSFTLCVSCILVRYFKVLLVFQNDSALKRVMKKLFLPYWIIGICVLIQGLICGFWLGMEPPTASESSRIRSELILQCDEGKRLFFGLMLAVISLLALVCFGFAFLGRKLPQCYNEERCISISMLIYIISWVVFAPIYANIVNMTHYKSAVQMVVMLFSAYGILICHFMPKCYIILLKSEKNTREAFTMGIREFARRFNRSSRVDRHRAGLDRPESAFTIDSGIENIINGVYSNPYPPSTISSFHMSIDNLPHEVSVSGDSLYEFSVYSGSSADMNEENQQQQTLSGSQKLLQRIKNNRTELKRTLSVPHF